MAAQLQPENDPKPKKGKLGKWKPKKWRPEYDRIVGYSVLGKSNNWIASNMGFTREHISTILNLPQAIELADQLAEKLRAKMVTDIPSELNYIAQRTVSRLKSLMDNDALFEKNPFAVIDRGMDVLKGLRHLQGGGNGAPIEGSTTNIGTVVIANGLKTDLLEGLSKVAEVRKLHTGKIDGPADK